MMERKIGRMGWEQDLPDFRDFTSESAEVKEILTKSRRIKTVSAALPSSVDLSRWCSPIEDQGQLGSCTANAGVGMLEYFERSAFEKYLDGSRLFLYKVTRNLLGWTGDKGAHLRDTMKAMVLFGVPPEQYFPYEIANFDNEPPSFCYSFAQNFKAIQYFRLDPPGMALSEVLKAVKKSLAAQLPCMFGFSVYSSIPGLGAGDGEIPYPGPGDRLEGGHALLAVGYDDSKKIGKEKGALMIRNSWGEHWGAAGYGWLPYRYIQQGLAVDFWSLARADFIDTDLFK